MELGGSGKLSDMQYKISLSVTRTTPHWGHLNNGFVLVVLNTAKDLKTAQQEDGRHKLHEIYEKKIKQELHAMVEKLAPEITGCIISNMAESYWDVTKLDEEQK